MKASVSRLAASVTLHASRPDQVWLFDARRGTLLSLNASAALMVEALSRGLDNKAIANAVAQRFDLSEELGLIEVRAFLARIPELLRGEN